MRNMNHDNGGRRAVVEALEPRKLLSASPIENVIGVYAGDYQFTAGQTGSMVITITSQHGAHFSGTSAQDGGPTARFQGTINRFGVVHFNYHGIGIRYSGHGVGAVDTAGTTLAATFITREVGQNFPGSFMLTRQ